MFVVVGTRIKTQPVPNGRTVKLPCSTCGGTTDFVEHQTQENLRLYFVDIVAINAQRVLRCTQCTTAVVTDELPSRAGPIDQNGTVAGHIGGAIRDGQKWLDSQDVRTLATDAAKNAQVLAQKVGEATREGWSAESVQTRATAVRRWFSGRKD